jgi:hypothetical protein
MGSRPFLKWAVKIKWSTGSIEYLMIWNVFFEIRVHGLITCIILKMPAGTMSKRTTPYLYTALIHFEKKGNIHVIIQENIYSFDIKYNNPDFEFSAAYDISKACVSSDFHYGN